jgi:hypothetical protein
LILSQFFLTSSGVNPLLVSMKAPLVLCHLKAEIQPAPSSKS